MENPLQRALPACYNIVAERFLFPPIVFRCHYDEKKAVVGSLNEDTFHF